MIEHVILCMENNKKLVVGVDYIVCQICNFHGQNLGIHLAHTHDMKSEVYAGQYSAHVMSANSQAKYAKHSSENNWLANAISNGQDLTEYWKKVGKGVSEAIMASPSERKRRFKLMKSLNDKRQSDPDFQKIVSETAKKTSARLDVQTARTANLKNWRDNNPEAFYEQCIKKMITAFQSKPEKKLFEFVSSLGEFSFKRNRFINSQLISNKSHNKQMDMGDKKKRVYVEFDGVLHFLPKRGNETLVSIKQRDVEIERHITNHKWILIRVSYDQFKYSTKTIKGVKTDASYFRQDCLERLIEILKSNRPGVYKIGEAYEQH